jgi:quercetin dioxygenase-like cupin family protein
MQLTEGSTQYLPKLPIQNPTILFYVFEGEVKVNDDILLKKGESILIERESPAFYALQKSDVLIFITDKSAPYFTGGMYSGNQQKRQ